MQKHIFIFLICLSQFACSQAQVPQNQLVETFEGAATKSKYEPAEVTFASGNWWLDNALIGTQEGDAKNEMKSLRLKQGGTARPLFTVEGYVKEITVQAATFGEKDKNGNLELWYSRDKGSTWQQLGETKNLTENTLQLLTFPVGFEGINCFELRNTSKKARVNIDDFTVKGKKILQKAIENTTQPAGDVATTTNNTPTKPKKGKSSTTTDETGITEHLLFGNPSKATAKESNYDNYLMPKREYVLAYNRSRGTANWVAWRLSQSWNGDVKRSNDFRPDPDLPASWFHAKPSDYTGSGFDRGHLCSSGDRDVDAASNSVTFLMTNIVPQAAANNQGAWNALELYCRGLVDNGDELYIYAGGDGVGGEGKNGKVTKIADGNITVPANTWKIIVVMPKGITSPKNIPATTRVIAIRMPNTMDVPKEDWGKYRVSVDKIEQVTGYDFLTEIPKNIQDALEATTDQGAVY